MMQSLPVLYLQIELTIPYSQSLKDKRSVMLRAKDRLRNQFNLSVVEAGLQDDRQHGVLAMVMVGHNRAQLERQAEAIERFVQEIVDAEVSDCRREWL